MEEAIEDILLDELIEAQPAAPATVEVLLSATTGNEIFNYLQALLPGRSAKNQGFSYNRVVKLLNSNGQLPANFGNISYGIMKAGQKLQLHEIIQGLSQERNGKDLFDKIKDAVLNNHDIVPPINDSDSEGGVIVNRWALMAEFYVHPSSRDELTRYFTKLSSDERPGVLTDGIKNHKRVAVTELLRICMEDVAPTVRNCFGEEWPALATIHPENGSFPSHDIFLSLLGEARSSWDVLKANLTKSGTQESGAILDSTAFDYCKYGQRTCKLHHFYLWLKWKKEDVQFLSNSLADGVAADGNASTPYSRKQGDEASSSKLSMSERRAAKGNHTEKMMGLIGKTVADAFLSLTTASSSDTGVAAPTAAYVAKEEQLTVSITLKRLRDTIESSSFSDFSPSTKKRAQDKYKDAVIDTLFH